MSLILNFKIQNQILNIVHTKLLSKIMTFPPPKKKKIKIKNSRSATDNNNEFYKF